MARWVRCNDTRFLLEGLAFTTLSPTDLPNMLGRGFGGRRQRVGVPALDRTRWGSWQIVRVPGELCPTPGGRNRSAADLIIRDVGEDLDAAAAQMVAFLRFEMEGHRLTCIEHEDCRQAFDDGIYDLPDCCVQRAFSVTDVEFLRDFRTLKAWGWNGGASWVSNDQRPDAHSMVETLGSLDDD